MSGSWKKVLEYTLALTKRVLRVPPGARMGYGSLPKANEFRAVSPGSQRPPEISSNLPLKTEPLAHQYMFERGVKGNFEKTPGVFQENQKALDFTKKIEYAEEQWKKINAAYGFDARNMRNWARYKERTINPDGTPIVTGAGRFQTHVYSSTEFTERDAEYRAKAIDHQSKPN